MAGIRGDSSPLKSVAVSAWLTSLKVTAGCGLGPLITRSPMLTWATKNAEWAAKIATIIKHRREEKKLCVDIIIFPLY